MTAQALTALKASIEHWQRFADGVEGETIGPAGCALCGKFLFREEQACLECPVFKRTGLRGCGGSPYEKAGRALLAHGPNSPQFRVAALEELAFLKSLLPEEGKK